MTDEDVLGAIELHSARELRAALDAGLAADARVRGKTLVDWLLEMYTRSDRFPECLALLLERGAALPDPRLAPVLLDDAQGTRELVRKEPEVRSHRTSLTSAFTPLEGVSLLHVAAEYGNVRAVRALLDAGFDAGARAAVDACGLGGHTPLFHAVNSSGNRSLPVMELLLDAGARCDVRLEGLVWGRGFEWETTCFDVTPISYAQLGLLPQFHRKESDVYANVARLLAHAKRRVPPLENVPNRYLAKG